MQTENEKIFLYPISNANLLMSRFPNGLYLCFYAIHF